MISIKILLPLLLLHQSVKSEDNEKVKYRLNGNLIPSKYGIELTVMDDFGSTGKFFGSVKIHFNTTVETSEITLHSDKLKFDAAHIQISFDPPQTSIAVSNVTFNTTLQMVTIKTKNPLLLNNSYVLSVNNYEGILDLDMNGFYRSSYKNAQGESEWIAVTQFQPSSARRAFPCFDEPQYKATFDILVNHPTDYHAVSNAEVKSIESLTKSKKTTFKTSPIMSTYLVAFAVTKFAGMTVSTNNIKHTIWSSIETVRDSQYALSISPKLLKVMENFTKIPYTISGLTKLDQFSIPDFSAGAMENWGMVTYRETAVLWNPHEYSSQNKERVGTVVAHELSHMLFGNLVTTKWWSSTWLNEGFATFFEYFSLAEIEKDWELDLQFVLDEHQPVLISDCLEKAKPLTNPDVFTSGDVSAMFGTTSYSKGGSIIRMMSLFLGDKTFYAGLNAYLTARKFSYSVPEDLFNKIQEKVDANQLPEKLSIIMKSWTEKHGFPMITVKKSENDLILSQTQFFTNVTPPTKWYIPVTYTTSDEKKFNDLKAKKWMLPHEPETIIRDACKSQTNWVVLNIGVSAFVRVNYDDTLWTGLQQALKKENFDGITPINRAQIVDDAMNLARASVITYERAFNVISFLEKDTDYYPWHSAFRTFSYLRRRIDRESSLGKILDKYIKRMTSALYKSVDFNNNNRLRHVDMLKKVLTLTWACQLGVSDCVSQSQTLFNNLMSNNKAIDPNLRSVVYCTAVRSTDRKDNWEYLWQKLEASKMSSESVTIISALGCTKNVDILRRYLNESIKENGIIRRQDAQSVFKAVISGSPQGVTIGLNFLNDSFEQISVSYGGMNALTSVINGIADRLTTKEDVSKLEEFIARNRDKLKDAATAADTAIETARKNLEWVVNNENALLQYLKSIEGGDTGNSNKAKSSILLVATLVCIALKNLS